MSALFSRVALEGGQKAWSSGSINMAADPHQRDAPGDLHGNVFRFQTLNDRLAAQYFRELTVASYPE